MEPATFTITRDAQAGGGYTVAEMSRTGSPGIEFRCLTIGAVNPSGPAAQAGMGQEHVGWRITHIEGEEVTVDNFSMLLDPTRTPGCRFNMTVRPPATGEVTFSSLEGPDGRPQFRHHVNAEDLDVRVDQDPNGGVRVAVSMPSALARTMDREQLSRVIETIVGELGRARDGLSEEEKREVERQEEEAAKLDCEAGAEESKCVVCLESRSGIVLLPCYHLATCHRCTVMVRRLGKCPVCREPIAEVKGAEEVEPDKVFRP
eukprot:TRINITY_DN104705_c0_g1_i1.p1 TRINITY_DN104705_c0_g1~~TRINITY_DN104705_c0_g1_i1.p1  ORF type:complete len:267 (-),score=42.85 TRINITY_DN104705_c0_g1_i1:60-839(-)